MHSDNPDITFPLSFADSYDDDDDDDFCDDFLDYIYELREICNNLNGTNETNTNKYDVFFDDFLGHFEQLNEDDDLRKLPQELKKITIFL